MEEKNKGTVKKIIRPVIVIALVLTALYLSFGGLIDEFFDRGNVDASMQEMQSAYSRPQKEPTNTIPVKTPDDKIEIDPAFDTLLSQNPDTIGWLTIEGIGYDGAVVQKDDSHYLKKDFYGNDSSYGAIFASQYNNLNPNEPKSANGYGGMGADDNIVLFGHNMLLIDAALSDHSNDRMFNNLVKYRKTEFFKQNPFWSFDTLWEKGEWVVVAVFIANVDPAHGEPFLYNTMRTFRSESEKQSFIDEVLKRSLVLTDTPISTDDRFLTLSTCDYDFDDERCVVVARKLRPGEDKDKLSERNVWTNEAPLMPQIWNEIYG